jgi:uncharacterized protein with HEPN domain
MPSDRDRLELIVYLIDLVEGDLGGIDEATFASSQTLIDATAYRVMHIGENAMHLGDAIKARHQQQPWRLIAGMRNFIAHDYDGTNLTVLWATVRVHLAPLRAICAIELATEG